MKDLIEALQIFLKHGDVSYPFHCEHDTLTVMYNPADFSGEDLARLEELGFDPGSEYSKEVFTSFKYGSA